MARLRIPLALVAAAFVAYCGFVWVWSIPEDPTNRANLILGGCESIEAISRENWTATEKIIPPTVRCVVRTLKRRQVMTADFREAQPWSVSTVQKYVSLASLDFGIDKESSAYRFANRGVILRSLDWLFENGADPDQCNENGMTALHVAVAFERLDLYDKWVLLGADPDITCDRKAYQHAAGRHQEWNADSPRAWRDSV